MRKYKYLLVIIYALFIIIMLKNDELDNNDKLIQENITHSVISNNNVIAHAGGGIDDITYTNSLEAIDNHYNSGTRIFEIDFMFTEDNRIVAVHYWQDLDENYSFYERPSYPEFSISKIKNLYTTLCLKQLLELMESDYPEMIIVIDTKEVDIENFYMSFINQVNSYNNNLLVRFVPQIYDFEMLETVESLSENHFLYYILTLYKIDVLPSEVLNYLSEETDIKLLTMTSFRYSQFDQEIIDELNNLDIKIYLHTLNNLEQINNYLANGIKGIYSDYVTENIINNIDN
ncbi:MAG: hypothetical protein ACQERX_04470 [Bacillota bacterium]